MASASSSQLLPPSLLDLLSNSLVLRHTTPYLPLSAIFALSATSKAFKELLTISSIPDVFRRIDLSLVRSADIKDSRPVDSGGISWRAERMDEALTEDEFYSGPLRGIFSKLQRRNLLSCVQTLVLDGLTVPADLVRDIVCEPRYNVRILSIREAKHLNERKLMQVLNYAVRPSRAEGTPKLKGLYFFGLRDPLPPPPVKARSRTPSPRGASPSGTQIGSQWNQRSTAALEATLSTPEKWYSTSGRMFNKVRTLEWADTIKACEGIIAFDAVLCRGPRHDINTAFVATEPSSGVPNTMSYLRPTIANVALGPSGCSTCSSCSEEPAVFGTAPSTWFPLLSPPPLHGSTIRDAQTPRNVGSNPVFMARCEECLRGRWCERCNKWWDEKCYTVVPHIPSGAIQQVDDVVIGEGATKEEKAKVGVKRECFGCGPTCNGCKDIYIRACHRCKNEYCVVDNEGSSETRCDWCNRTSRRTRAYY